MDRKLREVFAVVLSLPLLSSGNMRPPSEGGKSHVQQWLTGGFERGKFSNDPRTPAPVDDQDKTDDEYEEAREETEHNLPKEPTAKDHDRCDQKTDLDKASLPKIYDTDLKPQRATTGLTRENDGRDDRTEDRPTLKVHVTVDIIPTSGHKGEGRRDEHSQASRTVDSDQGPMPPRESPRAGHRGGDRKDEQRQSGRIGSKPEKDNGPRTVMETQEIGRRTAFKHPSPPRNMPGTAAARPIVSPAPPYKGKKNEEQRPQSCRCVVL